MLEITSFATIGHKSPVNQYTTPWDASPISPTALIPVPMQPTWYEKNGSNNDDDSEHRPGDEQQNDSLIRSSGFIFKCLKEKQRIA